MRLLGILVALIAALLIGLYIIGGGALSQDWHAGVPGSPATDSAVIELRAAGQRIAARDLGVAKPKQILFGDLHVHTTFSFDAFQMSLPMAGGDGAYPVSDACDYARHCSALDFWSINDHAITLTPRRWQETVEAIRQCNAKTDPSNPDLVSYLGWEWTQVGTTPDNHWGHKNVVLRDLEDGAIPTRPISAGAPEGMGGVENVTPSRITLGVLALLDAEGGGRDFVRYLNEITDNAPCEDNVPVRDLPADCQEFAPTPGQLFAKLDDWGQESMVIPHGTTWGFYTPPGSAWDKQLTPQQHDPKYQHMVEVFSGHGNSEEFRPWLEVEIAADGSRSCPAPTADFLPSCWRAGEIIAERCAAEGLGTEECDERAADARQIYVDTDMNGGYRTVPGTDVVDWQQAGLCTDCFQPSFNYRPKSSVQYMLALSHENEDEPEADPLRFRFSFIAASDNHSARPGTGYKEVARTTFTEQRFGNFTKTYVGEFDKEAPAARAKAFAFEPGASPFSGFETERQASFFLNGGLAAVHSQGRTREQIWDAMQRGEVYGTSGPRMLLWFDMLNGPGGRPAPMGSETNSYTAPIFQVRAQGSLEQNEGCPPEAADALGPDQLERLCRGECYNPSDQRRAITRIEVVRIRPQTHPDEPIEALVQDPWKSFECPADPGGCLVAFSDEEFASAKRDAVYYVRAIEEQSMAVAANPLGCSYDDAGRCVEIDPCFDKPDSDECLAPTEERAWSSPIYVDYAGR